MFKLIAAAVLIFGCVLAQDPDCDYRQVVGVNQQYFINNNYGPGRTCRYIGICPAGYNCRVDCVLYMPSSPGCRGDRLLISNTGDPLLAAAPAYCGRVSVTVVSVGNNISLGLIALTNSGGGSFRCNLTAQLAPRPPPPMCMCGQRKQTRIVGGQETKVNEYPMMAAIVENAIADIHCGGVIIASRYIMTAAHCVYPFRTRPQALSVRVGAHNIEGSNMGTTYVIARFIIHERYNSSTFDYDIALIVLQVDIPFTDKAMPVCLPFKFEGTDLTGRIATILGWGTTSFGGPTSNSLQEVDVRVINQNTCRASEGNAITDRQICSYAAGRDACQFDSGGPLLLTDPSNGLLFSIGIVSNGRMCGTGQPGVYTRVTELLRWVINNANSQFCIIR